MDEGLDAPTFVEGLKKQGKRVPGIGHRIKSKDNRDKRVELLQKYSRRVGDTTGVECMMHSGVCRVGRVSLHVL